MRKEEDKILRCKGVKELRRKGVMELSQMPCCRVKKDSKILTNSQAHKAISS